MERETKPPTSTSQVDDTLKAFYQNYKQAHTPSDDLLERMFQTIPESVESTATAHPVTETSPHDSMWERLRRQWRWFLAPTLVAACALLLVRQTGNFGASGANSTVEPRTFIPKSGTPSFQLYHSRYTPQGYLHKQATRLGEPLFARDGVQLSYQVPGATHVMLISVNERGETSVFAPLGGASSIQVQPGTGTLPRDTSLALDNYLGLERFFVLYSDQPFATSAVKQAVQQAFLQANQSLQAMKSLPGPWKIQTLLIRKTSRK